MSGRFKQRASFSASVLLLLLGLSGSGVRASYIISGSPDGTAPITVADFLYVYLNGTQVYGDGAVTDDPSGGTIPTFTFPSYVSPQPGDVLEFKVSNVFGFCNGVGPLYLTCRPGAAVLAAAGIPISCDYGTMGTGATVYSSSFTVPTLCSPLSLTVDPIKVPNNGTSLVAATATLVGNTFNGLSGHLVTLSIPSKLGTISSLSTQSTDVNGNAQFTIKTGIDTGTFQVSATDEVGDQATASLTVLVPPTGLPDGLTASDVMRRPGESDRDVVERLYKTAIPNGKLAGLHLGFIPIAGPLDNIVSALTTIPVEIATKAGTSQSTIEELQQIREGFYGTVCGGYQGKVLELFNSLRSNPATAAYFANLDYGPVKTTFGGHHAVVLYDKGTDFQTTGDVLDPWPHQIAEVQTYSAWNSELSHAHSGPDTQYPGEYPITGGSSYPSAGSRVLIPSAPFRPLDPPTDNSTYTLQVIVDGPVQALVTDPDGRQIGELADGSPAFQTPLSLLYQLSDTSGGPLTYFILTDLSTYRLKMTGKGTGTATVMISLGDPNHSDASYLEYQNIGVTSGAAISFPISFATFGQSMKTPSGSIKPVRFPPPGLTFASSNPETDVGMFAPGVLLSGQQGGASFVVTNNTGKTETISSATLDVTNPKALSSLEIEANGGQFGTPASSSIGSNNVFTFSPPVSISNGYSFGFGVVATMATSGPEAITATAIHASGAAGLVTGLPVTVLLTGSAVPR
jgi:hypothetical protein